LRYSSRSKVLASTGIVNDGILTTNKSHIKINSNGFTLPSSRYRSQTALTTHSVRAGHFPMLRLQARELGHFASSATSSLPKTSATHFPLRVGLISEYNLHACQSTIAAPPNSLSLPKLFVSGISHATLDNARPQR
jgi:hypothetical protein